MSKTQSTVKTPGTKKDVNDSRDASNGRGTVGNRKGTADAARIPAIALTQATAGKSETQEPLCPIVDTGEKDGGSHFLTFVCVPALADFYIQQMLHLFEL